MDSRKVVGMFSNLFTKEYLEQLQDYFESNFSIIDYIMQSKNMSFHDAIIELSKFCELKPEYVIPRKKNV